MFIYKKRIVYQHEDDDGLNAFLEEVEIKKHEDVFDSILSCVTYKQIQEVWIKEKEAV